MNFRDIELILWPFVLLVGFGITRINDNEKHKFWRDHVIMTGLIVIPATIVEWFFTAPGWVYIGLIGSGSITYLFFIFKWRRYLSSLEKKFKLK
jgi:hypothetical protein